jgi:hypothetical protein
MRQEGKTLGLSRKAYNAVYEGFWDLYCKKPANPTEIPVKKLEGFLSRVKLIVPPSSTDPDMDDMSLNTNRRLPLKAIARIRIPLNRPVVVPEIRDNEDDEGDGTNRSPPETARSHMSHQ